MTRWGGHEQAGEVTKGARYRDGTESEARLNSIGQPRVDDCGARLDAATWHSIAWRHEGQPHNNAGNMSMQNHITLDNLPLPNVSFVKLLQFTVAKIVRNIMVHTTVRNKEVNHGQGRNLQV